MFLYKMPTKHIPPLLLYYRLAVKAINGQYLLFETNGLASPLLLSSVLLKNILSFFFNTVEITKSFIICTPVFTPESVIIFSFICFKPFS